MRQGLVASVVVISNPVVRGIVVFDAQASQCLVEYESASKDSLVVAWSGEGGGGVLSFESKIGFSGGGSCGGLAATVSLTVGNVGTLAEVVATFFTNSTSISPALSLIGESFSIESDHRHIDKDGETDTSGSHSNQGSGDNSYPKLPKYSQSIWSSRS